MKKKITDFPELDIIGNAQYPRSTNKKANVGDTTIAGTTRQMMRSAIKGLPVVSVAINGSKQTLQALTCKSIINNDILNPTTFGDSFTSTLKLGGRGALIRGFNAFQVKAVDNFGQFGTRLQLLHYSDIGIEPGTQQNANLTAYSFVETELTPYKLKKILKKEKKNPNTTWNIKALQTLIEAGPDCSGEVKYSEYLTPNQQATMAGASTYTLIDEFSKDPDDDIITFSPVICQELRKRPNKSKFGFPRVIFLIIDQAETSPTGESRVRLASPDQNLMMALRRNVSTTWLYNSDPAIQQTGVFAGTPNLRSGAKFVATDPNAKISPILLDTTTSQQYPNISREIKGQILDMLGYNPSGNLGAIGESKTGVGAQTQRKVMDESSQEIASIIEDFVKKYVLSALDITISEQIGEESVIYVSDDIKRDIEAINPTIFDDPDNPNALTVNWGELYDYIKRIDVEVDTKINNEEHTDEQRADLQDTLVTMRQNSDPNDPSAQAKIKVVEDEFLDESLPNISQKISAAEQQAASEPQVMQAPPMM